ncbi:KinB-signaling pathway activation protein [Cohnella yongneupensis]|uniref:KinB-signaling pathway activation protein n=1 Tax=Cohnella yongneupensis TaxID=425006 RepID=A0ABW0QVB3_9BACL
MNLRRWMKLFGTTILIGALIAAITGIGLMGTDQEFQVKGTENWLVNIGLMALGGLTFGAFSHMGFFAYLMLNYIARSIFKRLYTWIMIQGLLAIIVMFEIGYWTYDTNFPSYTFWAVPLLLLGAALLVAWRKAHETSSGAWIPTVFFLVAITALESVPAFRTGSMASLVFQIIPLFVCNAYQIMRLHRILDRSPQAAAQATSAS